MAAPLHIRMHPRDNVAIVANDGGLPEGATFEGGLRLVERVPQGHKVALVDLPKGSAVLRYNVPIGYALKDIPAGSWVHERLLEMPDARTLDNLPKATVRPEPLPALEGYTFEGYRNADGSVGSRNILAITTTVQCVAGVVEHRRAAHQGRTAAALSERGRRGRAGTQLWLRRGHRRARRGGADPHAAEHQPQPELRRPADGGQPGLRKAAAGAAVPAGSIRSSTAATWAVQAALDRLPAGRCPCRLHSMIDSIMTTAERRLAELNQRRRETCPASDLVVGMQCGGSDAFSGVTANPALGYATDLLVRAGGTVMFSETTEVRDGIDQLTSRG
jgi:galactarate dehydratase